MSSATETSQTSASSGVLNWLKWLVVTALVGGAVFGNWYFRDESLLYRVGALLVVAVIATLIAVTTTQGGATWNLLKEARSEIRRVVWPTRTETNQTTLIVLGMVVLFAFVLWLLDSGLSWVVKSVIG